MTPQQLGDQPAFPHLHDTCQRVNESEHWPGLTKREVFAGDALKGILASFTKSQPPPELAAQAACEYADALLARLAAKGESQ